MTATYDGRLILRIGGKGIEPCCESMHRAIIEGVIYRGTTGRRPCVSMRMSERNGIPICRCPFTLPDGKPCGAEAEVVE